jgi:hypothetical protein
LTIDERFDPMSERNRVLGLVVLSLLSDWHAWVHRRVERLTFEDPVSVRRQTSVDFTLSVGLPAAIVEDGEVSDSPRLLPLFVPLGLLRKQPLTAFSVWDENDHRLPLLTSRRNGAVAAAVLIAAARALAATAQEPRTDVKQLPGEIVRDLCTIGTGDSLKALQTWAMLGLGSQSTSDDVAESDEVASWRRRLVASELFMSLANDLARNFLVLVPLDTSPSVRRVIKYDYIEEFESPAAQPLFTAIKRRAAMRTRATGWSLRLRKREPGASG